MQRSLGFHNKRSCFAGYPVLAGCGNAGQVHDTEAVACLKVLESIG